MTSLRTPQSDWLRSASGNCGKHWLRTPAPNVPASSAQLRRGMSRRLSRQRSTERIGQRHGGRMVVRAHVRVHERLGAARLEDRGQRHLELSAAQTYAQGGTPAQAACDWARSPGCRLRRCGSESRPFARHARRTANTAARSMEAVSPGTDYGLPTTSCC